MDVNTYYLSRIDIYFTEYFLVVEIDQKMFYQITKNEKYTIEKNNNKN